MAAERLDTRGWQRLAAGLRTGDPDGQVTAAWQLKELVRGFSGISAGLSPLPTMRSVGWYRGAAEITDIRTTRFRYSQSVADRPARTDSRLRPRPPREGRSARCGPAMAADGYAAAADGRERRGCRR